jgi:hypothetical protein
VLRSILAIWMAMNGIAGSPSEGCHRGEALRQLTELKRKGGEAEFEANVIENALNGITPDQAGIVLQEAAKAYGIMVSSGESKEKCQCLRDLLKNEIYAKAPATGLNMEDRLIRAVLDIDSLIGGDRGKSILENGGREVISRSINEFTAGFGAWKEYAAAEDSARKNKIDQTWHFETIPVQERDALYAKILNEFIDDLVVIAVKEPSMGSFLGISLSGILQDAMQGDWGQETKAGTVKQLQKKYDDLIAPDRENIAGTAQFYTFMAKRNNYVDVSDELLVNGIKRLLADKDALGAMLENGYKLIHTRPYAVGVFNEHSDFLAALGERLREEGAPNADWEALTQLSCDTLRRGIEIGKECRDPRVKEMQDKLIEKVRVHGWYLGDAKNKFDELIKFELRYYDPEYKILAAEQQCYINAHLAQAYYRTGDTRTADEHFKKSCGKISREEITGRH